MKVLVTGAGGMLGRDFVRAAEYMNHDVVALAHDDLDVVEPGAVEQVIRDQRPDVVVNCAGYTNVDGAQDDPITARVLNADAAGYVAAAAKAVDAAVMYPSTDYVFNGWKETPYVESDEARPRQIYGQSKLAGEQEVAYRNPHHWIVRTSWLFGVGGHNFVETMLTLGEEVEEVLVVRDQVGCPTYAGHLAEAMVELLEGKEYGVHHIAGGGECSWFDFAQEIFRQADVDCRVLSCTTEEFPRPASRPAYSVLGSERQHALYLPDWRDGLAAYMKDRAVASQ